jgi:hypothetical protein
MIISRRKILELGLVLPLSAMLQRSSLFDVKSTVVPLVEGTDVSRLKVERRWKGSVCQSRVVNQGAEPVRIKEVVLFDLVLSMPATTRLYGEGFQMLSQTGGTLGQPTDLGNYTDAKHYKLSAPVNAKAFYGMMMMSPSTLDNHLSPVYGTVLSESSVFESCSRYGRR